MRGGMPRVIAMADEYDRHRHSFYASPERECLSWPHKIERFARSLWKGLTSRELLYHLPCEYSARKLDRFGSGWLTPETAVRTFCVVVTSPAFRHDLRFLERVEQLAV